MRRFALLALLLAAACNTSPVGFGGLERVPDARSHELPADSLAGYAKYVALGAAGELLLGRDDQYEARCLLQVSIPDSALDSVAGLQLILHPVDSTAMTFVCRPCSTPWVEGSVNWKMADSQSQWMTPGGDYWPFELARDTLGADSLTLNLDVRYVDTLVRRSYGVMLLPLDTGFARIHAASSGKTAPRLKLTFLDGTTRNYTITSDVHIMDTLQVRTSPLDLLVGPGVAFRTWVRFDIESIPREATVAKAELSFRPRVLYRRLDTLGFGAHHLTEPFQPKGKNASYQTAADARTVLPIADTTDSIVKLDVARLVQFWTAHPDSNFGLVIMSEPEYSRPWRVKLPRAGEDAPRLRVQYVLPPQDRFFR
jgi:hypothetical protein